MHSLSLNLDWNDRPIKGTGPLNRVFSLRCRLEMLLKATWEWLEQITFGLFMGSLIALLILLYADAPIVGL
jgi:uncharacterized membrane protein YraQ (UPF0718 family)